MTEFIQIGDISIAVTRKDIKNVHLSVHPPEGDVTLSAPTETRLEVARAYAITRLSWIREQQEKLRAQARETPREFIERESHYLWGRRHLLTVIERDTKPSVTVDHKRITLIVRPGSNHAKRASIIHEWHKSLLHEVYSYPDQQVGTEARRAGNGLFPPADEDQMGELQSEGWAYQVKYRTREETQRSDRIRCCT